MGGIEFYEKTSTTTGFTYSKSFESISCCHNTVHCWRSFGGIVFTNFETSSVQINLVGNFLRTDDAKTVQSYAIVLNEGTYAEATIISNQTSVTDDSGRNYLRVRGDVQRLTQYSNSFNPSVTYGTTSPTTGAWKRGDIVYNLSVSNGGVIGYVCTQAGSPGIWRSFGTVSG